MMKLVTFGLLPFALIACGGGPWPAPATAIIEEVEDYSIVPSSAHEAQDGLGTILMGDIMVVDELTEMALDNIEVEILTGWPGVYVLPEGAIKLVDYPAPPDDVLSGASGVSDYCDVDSDGAIDGDAPEWCSWWWDTDSAAFYEFGGDYAMTSENYQPTYMIGSTDNRGICRFYLYVDSLPMNEAGEFSSVDIWVSIGVDSISLTLDAGS
jgi:hypothetical protein